MGRSKRETSTTSASGLEISFAVGNHRERISVDEYIEYIMGRVRKSRLPAGPLLLEPRQKFHRDPRALLRRAWLAVRTVPRASMTWNSAFGNRRRTASGSPGSIRGSRLPSRNSAGVASSDPLPDPFRAITDDHHHRLGAEPAQFPQLGIQPMEDGIGIAQTAHQKAPHYRAASGRSLDSLLRQQQNARLDLAKLTFGNGRQRR